MPLMKPMDYSSYQTLAFRRDGRVLHVTLNRPDHLNAFVPELHDELEQFLLGVARDSQVHAIVLSGAGRAFSAGGDFEELQRLVDEPRLMHPQTVSAKRLINVLLDVPQPIVAKINGPAIGLGATIALMCDVIFAASGAKIADPHVKIGFVAGDGGALIWPQLIGYARAKQYLLTGDSLTGEEAAKIGLINFAYPAAELDAAVDTCAHKLASLPRQALQWTKASINIGLKQLAASILDASVAYEVLSNHTRDHGEAVAALREKRAPIFDGT
jgi:enoyl-CoA hydratase